MRITSEELSATCPSPRTFSPEAEAALIGDAEQEEEEDIEAEAEAGDPPMDEGVEEGVEGVERPEEVREVRKEREGEETRGRKGEGK